MSDETSKQATRRGADRRYATRWLVGEGIDIGCGYDCLSNLASFFPLMRSVRPWDIPDGDAMLMAGVPDSSFDFVHSSHCLEHLVDPVLALENWIRVCRENGHIVVTVPDEDLYEQGVWPSTFNADHKWTFTIAKAASWSPKSVNVIELIGRFLDRVEVLKIELLDSGFRYDQPRYDQSAGPLSESGIEFVLRKKPAAGQRRQPQPVDMSRLFATAVDHHRAGRLAEAEQLYRALIAARPQDVASLNNLALLTGGAEAEALLRRAVELQPDYLDAQCNLGTRLAESGRPEEAAACFARAIEIDPSHRPALAALADALERAGRHEDAMAALEVLVEQAGETADTSFRLGRLCEALSRHEEAAAHLDRALRLDPDHDAAHVFKGRLAMRAGDFGEGARGFARMWRSAGIPDQAGLFVDEDGAPRDLGGMTVLLSADSGLGDTIQFVRYADLLKTQGATVLAECQPELARLLACKPEIDAVVPLGQPLPAHDHRVPLHNLIGAFRTTVDTVPSSTPYLAARPMDTARWTARLRSLPGLKVGLVWAGNPGHSEDRRRSIEPSLLQPLAAVPGVSLVSLQRGAKAEGLGLADWTDDLVDLAETAALVEGLDLVVAVDTAIAHLAGALGRPVWLLNRYDGCWRWLERRSDSPWYPTLRQFRQSRRGDWNEVIEAVASELASAAGLRVAA